MKQKALLLIILISITALLFSIKKGIFNAQNDSSASIELPEKVDYNFHIKPILSDKCYTCHGPDANKRKAGLRMDIESSAFSELPESPGKFALVAGKPNSSIAYLNMISDDPDEMMPPPDSKLKLNSYEKRLIKKWIKQGGKFQKHWAFIAPLKSEPPVIENTGWPQNEIDYFILKKIEENNLVPSKKAKIETLIRRISLDLTGLPPKPEFVKELVKGKSGNVIKEVVDHFLGVRAYGERMTQNWLDVARYADSHGYQDDSYRTMWPWRDWVIHAFNKNLPYDEFLVWQLAGDLLPNATKEQILATGFNRNHPITQEGGVIQEEYRINYVLDRTNTLGKGILGLTLECARC
ncbi:MAG: DUF1549 domain-containing protein, partial [Maribacter sp.]|nr:DUF1549 domain-containing protein [Maribacter sp.]